MFRLLGALGLLSLLLAAWLGVRLSSGPLPLTFLTPYIEDALSGPDHGLTVRLDRTVLVWDSASGTLEIRVLGVRALDPRGTLIAAGPEMSVSLSGPALWRGMVVPRSLRLLHPQMRVQRDAKGAFTIGLGDVGEDTDSSAALGEAFAALLAPPIPDTPTGQLQRVEVVEADLTVEDQMLGARWHIPKGDLSFRRDAAGISGLARLAVDLGGETSHIALDGQYHSDGRVVEANLYYGGLRPSLLASLLPQLKPLEALHLPTGGTVSMRYAVDRGPTEIRFDLAGGNGVIDGTAFGGPRWPVSSVALRGSLGDGLDQARLDELRIDLGGPRLTLAGRAEGLGGPLRLELDGRVEDLPVDQLKTLWPAGMAPNPRSWITGNLSRGRIRDATLHLAAHLPAAKMAPGKASSTKAGGGGTAPEPQIDRLQIDRLEGEVMPEGVTVQYLAPMPPVRDVTATAHYDQNDFVIDITSGEVLGLTVQQGRVTLSGLSAREQVAEIGLKIAGPVSGVLSLIDSKPLGWARQLGIVPARIRGDSQIALDLRIPLLAKLGFDQIKVHARAQTQGVAIPNVALGLDLGEGALTLDVDPQGMDVGGKAQLGGVPAEITWRENFTRGTPFRSRYLVRANLDDAGRKVMGLGVAPFQAPYISGLTPVEVTALLEDGGRGDIEVKADLTPATMALPGLNWHKPPGGTAAALARLRLDGGHLAEIPHFTVSAAADGLAVEGRVAFEDGSPRRVSFERARWGRTDVHGSLALNPDGLAIEAAGESFDAREMLSGTPSGQPKPPREERHKPPEEHQPMEIRAHLRQAWVTDSGRVRDVAAVLRSDRRDWREMRLEGRVGDDQPLRLEIAPAGPGARSLKVTGGDAGSVFRAFEVFDNVVGGQLRVEARYDDTDPRQPLKGEAVVSDYHLVKAPALARLLTVAALTGILDVLTDQGISFSTLEAPFTLTDGLLSLHDARAAGPALGLTAKGEVDLDEDRLALEGTVVPAYMLNSALGNLPLLGGLFSAEKGGGLVAMTYSMKGPSDDPTVRVNPLSALTPGVLRKLFDLFDDGHGTDLRGKTGAAPPSAPPPSTKAGPAASPPSPSPSSTPFPLVESGLR